MRCFDGNHSAAKMIWIILLSECAGMRTIIAQTDFSNVSINAFNYA